MFNYNEEKNIFFLTHITAACPMESNPGRPAFIIMVVKEQKN